jgi:hypothetical protein
LRTASTAALIGLALFLTPASAMAGFSIDDVSVNEGDSGVAHLIFTVTLDFCGSYCSVRVDTLDDTAVAGSDYITSAGFIATLTSPVPQQWPFVVPVLSGTQVELTERMIAILTDPIGATIDDAGGYGEIVNDDSTYVRIWANSNGFAVEGNPVGIRVRLYGVVDATVLAYYETADQTAQVVDGDYLPRAGAALFDPAPIPQTVPFDVTTLSDAKVELDETFITSLTGINASGRDVTIDPGWVTTIGTIVNNDSAAVTITDVDGEEGDVGTSTFTFTVGLDAEVDVGVDVDFATADGTATVADNDYVSDFGTLLFAGSAGETETVPVTVNGDVDVEPDENFFVDLSNIFASGRSVILADSQGEGIILTDEAEIFSDGFESGDTSAWSNTVQ